MFGDKIISYLSVCTEVRMPPASATKLSAMIASGKVIVFFSSCTLLRA
jgi:hypothetical protein